MTAYLRLVILTLAFSVNGLALTAMKGPPRAEKNVVKHIAKEGEDVKLLCPIQGHPTPMVTWSKEDEVINYSWTRFRTNKRHMKIKTVMKDDTGVYKCKGINGFGNVEIKVELIVVRPEELTGLSPEEVSLLAPPALSPQTRDTEKSLVMSLGSSLRLRCSVSGFPKPVVLWYSGDMEFKGRGEELYLDDLQQRDSGSYSCVAQNIIGTVSTTFEVSVTSSSASSNTSPANISVEQGDTATLDCRVNTQYAPNIKWLKKLETGDSAPDREVINVGSDYYRMIDNDNDIIRTGAGEFLSELILTSATPQDEGMYICFVTSLKGGFNFKPSYLSVIKKTDTNSSGGSADDFQLLIIVICISVITTLLIIGTVACLVQKKQKISSPTSIPESVQIAPEKPIFKKQLPGTYEKPNFQLTSTRLEDLLSQSAPLNTSESSYEYEQPPQNVRVAANNYFEFPSQPVYEVPTLHRPHYAYYEGPPTNYYPPPLRR